MTYVEEKQPDELKEKKGSSPFFKKSEEKRENKWYVKTCVCFSLKKRSSFHKLLKATFQ